MICYVFEQKKRNPLVQQISVFNFSLVDYGGKLECYTENY